MLIYQHTGNIFDISGDPWVLVVNTLGIPRDGDGRPFGDPPCIKLAQEYVVLWHTDSWIQPFYAAKG